MNVSAGVPVPGAKGRATIRVAGLARAPANSRPNGPGVLRVAMLAVMAACLGAVATRAHIAPAPRCAPALIEKEPPTRVVGASADATGPCGNDEVGGRPKHGCQERRGRGRAGAGRGLDVP